MRQVVAISTLLVLSGCSQPALTAAEYRDMLTERSTAYVTEAENIRVSHLYDLERSVDGLVKSTEADQLEAAVLAETARRSASMFAAIGDAVKRYADDIAVVDPPDSLQTAHEEFVTALQLSITGIGAMVGSLADASSFQEINETIGGSTFNDTQHRVDAACAGLEGVLAEIGEPADLHCRGV